MWGLPSLKYVGPHQHEVPIFTSLSTPASLGWLPPRLPQVRRNIRPSLAVATAMTETGPNWVGSNISPPALISISCTAKVATLLGVKMNGGEGRLSSDF